MVWGRVDTLVDERGHQEGERLGLTGPSAGNGLEEAAAIADRGLLLDERLVWGLGLAHVPSSTCVNPMGVPTHHIPDKRPTLLGATDVRKYLRASGKNEGLARAQLLGVPESLRDPRRSCD